MADTFLRLANEARTKTIGVGLVMKNDIIPWFLVAGFVVLANLGVIWLAGSFNDSLKFDEVAIRVATSSGYLYIILIILAVFVARRSKGAWSFVVAVLLIGLFRTPFNPTLAFELLPHTLLNAMCGMLGLLAAGRLVELIQISYVAKLTEPRISVSVVILYVVIIVTMVAFTFPRFW